jgi:hypothetical protein
VSRAIGPIFYGHLIGNGADMSKLFVGYLIGAGVMIVGGFVELVLGIPAERKPLEAVARPLSLVTGSAVPIAAGATTAALMMTPFGCGSVPRRSLLRRRPERLLRHRGRGLATAPGRTDAGRRPANAILGRAVACGNDGLHRRCQARSGDRCC